MRIPKAILGVVSAYLQPQEIHTLLLFYKYDLVDVLKIAVLHGAYVNDIVSYPKWPLIVYYEIIHFTLAEWPVESLNIMYKNLYELMNQRLLNQKPKDLQHLQNIIIKYDINRETVFDLLYELIFNFNCGLDLEYKMAVIKHIVAHADYYMLWTDSHYGYDKMHSICKCIIETRNLHAYYYIYHNIDYIDSDNNNDNNVYNNDNNVYNKNLKSVRTSYSGIYKYIGSAYENDIAWYNTLKINYDGIHVSNLFYALKNKYYVYAAYLVNNRPTKYGDIDIGVLLVNVTDIDHKEQYLNFIFDRLIHSEQRLHDILNNHQFYVYLCGESHYKTAIQCIYNYIKNRL